MDRSAIKEVALFPLSIPLKAPFITSLGALHEVESVVVKVTTLDGLIGWGECNPFWPINGETQETAMAVGKQLARVSLGRDALDIEGAHAAMDRLIFGNSSIKSAFDIALHDIAAQQAGVPLWEFLGAGSVHPLITDYTVSIASPEKMAADALAIVHNGFTVIKVKLGSGGAEDVERIGAIRAAIGNKIPTKAGIQPQPSRPSTHFHPSTSSIARNRSRAGSSWSCAG